MEDDDLIRVLFAELVDDLGGIVKLDAKKLAEDAKQNKFKQIAVRVDDGVVTVEVFDEDESEASE